MAQRRSPAIDESRNRDTSRQGQLNSLTSYETIMNIDEGTENLNSSGRGVAALGSRLVAFRSWLEENNCRVHPSVCIVNGEATDGTKNAPVLLFGPPPSATTPGNSNGGGGNSGSGGGSSSTDKTHGRCGLIDTDMDRVLYDRTMGCQVRTVKELKKDEVILTMPTSLFITPDLIASSDAGQAVLACCQPLEAKGGTSSGFWDAFGNTTEREKKHIDKLMQWSGTQLLVKILHERKRVETVLTKAWKDLEDVGGTITIDNMPAYKLIERGSLCTRAPVLAFLIHQRFSNQLNPPVSSSALSPSVKKLSRKTDAVDDSLLPSQCPPASPETFAPYARTLPPSVPLPICWKRNELALLAGCIPGLSILQEIVAETMALSADLISLVEAGLHYRFPSIFSKNMLTWDRWVWAASVHSSRILPASCYYNNGVTKGVDHVAGIREMFYSPPEIWDELGVIIPFVDMLNHEAESAQVTLQSPASSEEVAENAEESHKGAQSKHDYVGVAKLVLNKRVKKGSQIYTNYGFESNKELILRYGFAQLSNPSDTVSVGWGLSDCVGNVAPPSDYKSVDDTDDANESDQSNRYEKYLLYESVDNDLVNKWWSPDRLSVLENEIKAHKTFWIALRSGKKMSPMAYSDGSYDPIWLTSLVVATMPRSSLTKHVQAVSSSVNNNTTISIDKRHQYVIRKYLIYFFSRKIERLLQSLSNGVKDHFNQVKLWTKVTEGGLHYKGSSENASDENFGAIGWQTFFDSHAYVATVEVEKMYYSIAPDCCVLTLYDGHLRALQVSLDSVLSESKFVSGVLNQLGQLGFHISDNDEWENESEHEEVTRTTEDMGKNEPLVETVQVDELMKPVEVVNDEMKKTDEIRRPEAENAETENVKPETEKKERRNRRNRNRKGNGPPAVKLHLGNLAYQTTPNDLFEFFASRYGRENVVECHIPTERDSGKSRGFGFVTMTEAVAYRVLQSGYPHEIDGRVVKIAESNTSSSSRGNNPIPKGVSAVDRCITCGYRPRYCTCPVPNLPGMPPHPYGGAMPPGGGHGPVHLMPHDDVYGGPPPGMMGNYHPGMMGHYNPDLSYYGRGPHPDYDRGGRHRSRSWTRDRSHSRSPSSRYRGNSSRGDVARDGRHYDNDHRDKGRSRSYSRSRSRSYSRGRRGRDSERDRDSSRRSSRRYSRRSGSHENGKSSRYNRSRSSSPSDSDDSRSMSYSKDESTGRRNVERDRDRKASSSGVSHEAVHAPTTSKGNERSRSRSSSMPPQAREHEPTDHEKKREGGKRSRTNRSRSDSRERSSRKRKRSSKSSRRSKDTKYRSPSSSSSDSESR